ncbi:MAG: hypothetical protein EOM26_05930 [Alphaproteobacteria bacterium]|nr:hypothetical protein [Alphaproteobacteria bacterium]
MRALFSVLIALAFVVSSPAAAQDEQASRFRATDLPVPRFVSLRADTVFARTGPALRYPVRWVYTRGGLPVEIIREYDTWRKIRDPEGEEGWVHQSLLAGRRTALITADSVVAMRRGPDERERMVAKLEPGVVAGLSECGKSWCLLEVQGFTGWVDRNSIWGIYPQEELN